MQVKKKILLISIPTLICFALFFSSLVSYLLANFQYERLIRINPSDKAELECCLFLYSTRIIDINNSLWGTRLRLQNGEYCQSYRILGIEPIDVIYDSNNRVKEILPSFE